ncbi:hypothetical protein [Parvibaculum sp.]|uniref:hypothetical protein n=1 Tax=Parvibaculum sp. TaxID=2024848 RepID=UPI000C8E1E2B|nr:hypothetical protein [Parvibaculum sp.]MAB13889.1 hypothetical protein [Parvibaculum sp.]
MTNISFQRDENDLPLIVDLDRTLLRTDTLIEQFLILFLAAPRKALSALHKLRKGKAFFKEAVIDLSPVSPDALVLNEELLGYLLEQREKGRPLHLITAADQRGADAAAQKVRIFDQVIGSSDGHNLKGANKRDYLLEDGHRTYETAVPVYARVIMLNEKNSSRAPHVVAPPLTVQGNAVKQIPGWIFTTPVGSNTLPAFTGRLPKPPQSDSVSKAPVLTTAPRPCRKV